MSQELLNIFSEQATLRIENLHKNGMKIVLVTGVFDLLHAEHIAFLQKARALGDALLVGLESDVRVKQIKGEGRPVHGQLVRQKQIEELGLAELVFILPDTFSTPDQHRQLIREVRPAFLAVSSHTAHLDKKSAILKEFGGEVKVVHQHNPEVSTTKLLAERQQK